jgi:uncharacterized membrane protein
MTEDEYKQAPETATHREERKETGRIEAFSDGVFAVAVTLLIFNIHIPDTASITWTLMAKPENWLGVLAYVISFLTILVMWVNHHSIFQFIVRVDRPFVYLNGALLLLIVFVNYPMALIAKYATDTTSAKVAATIYSATLVVMSLLYNGLWRWAATNHRLLASDADHAEVDRLTAQYRFGPLLYLLAFGLAFFAPWLSIGLNAALAVYFAFTGQIMRAHTDHHH